jgi:hypothetical protein
VPRRLKTFFRRLLYYISHELVIRFMKLMRSGPFTGSHSIYIQGHVVFNKFYVISGLFFFFDKGNFIKLKVFISS